MSLAMASAPGNCGGSRWLVAPVVMILSIAALAETAGRLDITPAYHDDRLADEIYESGRDWRKPPAYANEWRPESQPQESRIQFGYASVYEERRMRGRDDTADTGLTLRDPKPGAQFKIGF